MKKTYYSLGIFLFSLFSLFAQIAVELNYPFQPQEKISYNVYYNVIGIYVNAGTATFTTSSEKMESEDIFHIVGEGSTNPHYDWIFKVA